MFGFFKKRTKPDFEPIRQLLFGDVALADWRPRDGEPDGGEPWASFERTRRALSAGETGGAIAALRGIAAQTQESRQYLQAWHFLRQLGVQPADVDAKRVCGVVLEVHLRAGLDTLAAYADHTARYINHGGRLIVWETPEDEMTSLIDNLIQVGQEVVNAIGPWEGDRPGAPSKGHARINLLTPSGLHFGQGPLDALSRDPMGAPVIAAGTGLMQALIERVEETA